MYDSMTLIPLPDDVTFCEIDKKEIREFFKLPLDKKIIFWGTTQPESMRKGKLLFDECLDILWNKLDVEQRDSVIILNVGPSAGKFGIDSSFNTLYTGYIHTRAEMSLLYKLSDISVCTTIADAGPMMISESMCNETPVVAFDRSISCDLCVDGETGYLVKDLDIQRMSDSIEKLLFSSDLEMISQKSRQKYLSFHGRDKVLQKWKNLFDSILKDKNETQPV